MSDLSKDSRRSQRA